MISIAKYTMTTVFENEEYSMIVLLYMLHTLSYIKFVLPIKKVL